jgi:hypothetical protein
MKTIKNQKFLLSKVIIVVFLLILKISLSSNSACGSTTVNLIDAIVYINGINDGFCTSGQPFDLIRSGWSDCAILIEVHKAASDGTPGDKLWSTIVNKSNLSTTSPNCYLIKIPDNKYTGFYKVSAVFQYDNRSSSCWMSTPSSGRYWSWVGAKLLKHPYVPICQTGSVDVPIRFNGDMFQYVTF